jgi:VanZ family protein
LKLHPKLFHFALISYLLLIFIASSIPGEEIPKIGFEFSDKLIHAVVYLILFILFFYSLKYQTKSVKLRNNAIMFAGIFSALYGVTDEIHQRFVPMRSCELSDWIADVTGVFIGIVLVKFVTERKSIMTTSLLLMTFIIACNTSGKIESNRTGVFEPKIVSEECWTDHMPVADERGARLGFQIMIGNDNAKDSMTVERLLVSRTNGEFSEKSFETRFEESTEGKKVIVVIQDRNENYFSESLSDNEKVQFRIIVTNKKGIRKTLTTSEIKPYKVY